MPVSDIVTAIVNAVPTVQKNILGAVVLVLLLVLCGLAYTIHTNFTAILDRFPSVAVEQERFGRSLEANAAIQSDLDSLSDTVKASRVTVFQFSNGSQDLTGIPFVFIRATHGHTTPGISLGLDSAMPVPLGVYSEVLQRMWSDRSNPVCVVATTNSIVNAAAKARLEARGTVVLAWCPITDARGHAIGVMSAEWLRDDADRPDNATITRVASTTAVRVSAHLSSVLRR